MFVHLQNTRLLIQILSQEDCCHPHSHQAGNEFARGFRAWLRYINYILSSVAWEESIGSSVLDEVATLLYWPGRGRITRLNDR
jgi:hypothetical protein